MLRLKMQKYAEELKFEDAELCKQRYLALENFAAKSEIVNYTITDVDVFTIVDDDTRKNAFVNYIHVKNGSINQSFTYEYKRKLDETDEELLNVAILEIRERFKSTAKEIIVPFELDFRIKDAEFVIPKRGDKWHLLELSEMNAKQYKFDRLKAKSTAETDSLNARTARET